MNLGNIWMLAKNKKKLKFDCLKFKNWASSSKELIQIIIIIRGKTIIFT